tara:strand:+ start:169 stop:795 length:627 start_codon:yes stop_codon:yes gene_type:complete
MTKFKSLIGGIGGYNQTNKFYDNWSSSYDKTLSSWNYKAPRKASLILKSHLSRSPKKILDLACGTGLFAEEILKIYPKTIIDGVDISKKILHEAKVKKIYSKLICSNFDKKLILKVSYDIVSCIGAMTYTKNPKILINEVSKLVNKYGFFIFTHRIDLWKKQDFSNILDSLSNIWDEVFISNPVSYLPKNSDFNQKIKIKIILLRRKF